MSETESVVHIGDQMPRVRSVSYNGAYEIVVSWAFGTRERNADIVDLAPVVLTHKFYRPLRDNPEMLKTVHIIADGAAIAWGENDVVDMAATTIERLAEETMDSDEFRAWLERHKFTYDAATAQLGISRRLVAYYASTRRVPRYIALACRYLDSELAPNLAAAIAALQSASSSTSSGSELGALLSKASEKHERTAAGALGKGSSSFDVLNDKKINAILTALIKAWEKHEPFAMPELDEPPPVLRGARGESRSRRAKV
jgi:hypothetical protein